MQRTQQRIGNTVSRIIGIYCWVYCKCMCQSLSSYHHRSCSFSYRCIELEIDVPDQKGYFNDSTSVNILVNSLHSWVFLME